MRLLLMVLVVLTACSTTPSSPDSQTPAAITPAPPVFGAVLLNTLSAAPTFQGRWFAATNGNGTITQGSSFQIGTDGTEALTVDLRVADYVTAAPTLAVQMDDQAPTIVTARSGVVLLASGLDRKAHNFTVTVSGINEFDQNWQSGPALTVGEAHANQGTLTATVQPQRHILFIGDSVTAGITARGNVGGSTPANSAAEATYATLTARALGVVPIIDAYGGTGLSIAGIGGVPGALDRLGLDRDGMESGPSAAPDLIVVNLGVNDLAHHVSRDLFSDEYAALLSGLARMYPAAKQVVLQPFNGDYQDTLPGIAQRSHATYLNLHGEAFRTTDGPHLSLAGQRSAAIALIPALRSAFPDLF